MPNEIVPFQTSETTRAIIPGTYEAVMSMAHMISQSGLAPGGMDKPEKVAIALFYGLEIGLTPMSAIQTIAVVNGRPALWGDAAIALVRSSGICDYVRETIEGEGDARVAVCETKRKGDPHPTVRRFSVDDAKLAGLWQTQARVMRSGRNGDYEKDNDSPWYRYPARMLQMRARAFCLRDAFADVLRGIAIAEEQQDVQNMRDVTPVEDAPVPPSAKAPVRPVEGEVILPEKTKAENAKAETQAKAREQERPANDAPEPPAEKSAGEKKGPDPFATYLETFAKLCAGAKTEAELRTIWAERNRDDFTAKEQIDELVRLRDEAKARLSIPPTSEGSKQKSAQPDTGGQGGQIGEEFEEARYRAEFLNRLKEATTGEMALDLNDEANEHVEAGRISRQMFEEFYESPLADAIERLP